MLAHTLRIVLGRFISNPSLGLVIAVLHLPVSPASPLYAMRLCLFKARVLSSVALSTVGPRMAAFDVAMIVKSLPVIPKSTSDMTGCFCVRFDGGGGRRLLTGKLKGF